jgi:hypothetical protein
MSQRTLDAQIVFRLAAPLREELEEAAAEDGRDLASLIRKLCRDFALQRFTERADEAA